MFQISQTHFAASWLLDERAPKVAMPDSLRRRIESMREGGRTDG
jgi:oligopeptide transport system ATP-binding protein